MTPYPLACWQKTARLWASSGIATEQDLIRWIVKSGGAVSPNLANAVICMMNRRDIS